MTTFSDVEDHSNFTLESAIKSGLLDPGLEPSLRRLNSIPGVATHYSCGGHSDKVEGDGFVPAYVIFSLDDEKHELLLEKAEAFVEKSPVDLALEFKYTRSHTAFAVMVGKHVWLSVNVHPEIEVVETCFNYLADFLEKL